MAFKKSNKGCIVVYENDEKIYAVDEKTFEETESDPYNKLEVVFKDGKMIKEYSLQDIRNRLHDGKF